mmetsp:Transcript_136265/g.435987  ORF Transcript_136265/g.435987 Transcript_136265/m.435987 type:complete len:434 (-) Transcript_136265:153-1454(-)
MNQDELTDRARCRSLPVRLRELCSVLAHVAFAHQDRGEDLEEVLGRQPTEFIPFNIHVQLSTDCLGVAPLHQRAAPCQGSVAQSMGPQLQKIPAGIGNVRLHTEYRVASTRFDDVIGPNSRPPATTAATASGRATSGHQVVSAVKASEPAQDLAPIPAFASAVPIRPPSNVLASGAGLARIRGGEGGPADRPLRAPAGADALELVQAFRVRQHSEAEKRRAALEVRVRAGQLGKGLLQDARPQLVVAGEAGKGKFVNRSSRQSVVDLDLRHLICLVIEQADLILAILREGRRGEYAAQLLRKLRQQGHGGGQPGPSAEALQVFGVGRPHERQVLQLVPDALSSPWACPTSARIQRAQSLGPAAPAVVEEIRLLLGRPWQLQLCNFARPTGHARKPGGAVPHDPAIFWMFPMVAIPEALAQVVFDRALHFLLVW